jgi:Reverse transcriptase (RNA-dependent DNA polymerase)
MAKTKKSFWHFRPLLTETLPYELPVIFGNDRLYYSRCRAVDPLAKPLLETIFKSLSRKYTIPYNYSIRKDDDRSTELSLIHPLMQLEFCEFYEKHESTLLDFCNRSEFSLRHPAAVAAVYILPLGELKESVHKTGEVHLAPDSAEPALAKLVSYFAYEKFNLLNKFYESKEFIRLEKKFKMLRHLDISKCFYSIYTHSIAWATKTKEFAKNNTKAYSFESHFDSLMQRSNYNETNGIVVGPEFSRIFAEIILQSIDRTIQNLLFEKGLIEGVDYAIRRYVDDYSIFANSDSDIESIDKLLSVELSKYKLYINESKLLNFTRPFVSNLTQARGDIRSRLGVINELINSSTWKTDDVVTGKDRRIINSLVHDVRIIAKRHDVKLSGLSGSLIGNLRTLARLANKNLNKKSSASVDKWLLINQSILETAFYVVSVDLRVRTTYSLCQLLSIIHPEAKKLPLNSGDLISHKMTEELGSIIRGAVNVWNKADERDCIEISNLLITGSYLLKEDFIGNGKIQKILEDISKQKLTYFKYITLKYCYLSNRLKYKDQLERLNEKAVSMLHSIDEINRRSELFHLLCDFLGAPDVPIDTKRSVYKGLYGGNPSNAALLKLVDSIGFTDWMGVSIEHSLKRRQMRPVYAVA